MLFFTNRTLTHNSLSNLPRVVRFNLSDNSSNNEIFFCKRIKKDKYEEIGNQVFWETLRNSKFKQILIYIHGYNNLPEDNIFQDVERLQNYFDNKEKDFMLVVPLIWPCDNDLGIIKDYWDDQISADMSSFAIRRVLNFFQTWSIKKCTTPCYKYINILAHSMGNRVLRESLLCWKKYDIKTGIPRIFRNIFLMAADLVNETLEYGKNGEIICDAARNVIVYHANDDLALRTSKIMNLKNKIASKRLGHTGPEKIKNTPKNVYVADCDEINNIHDFPKGHTYFLPSKEPGINPVLEHVYSVLETGRFEKDGKTRNIIINK